MPGKAILLAIVAAVMAVLLTSGVAVAQLPPGPAVFFGTATIGGSPAPDGTVVTAEIGGVEYARTTTSGGRYGDVSGLPPLQIPADDPSTPEKDGGVSGDTIAFKVNGVAADQTALFEEFDIQTLDLTAPAGVGGGGGGGSGGGGGGGGAPPTYYTGTNLFGAEKSYRISRTGEILSTIEATSADGMLTITIPAGTIALDKDGNRLSSLTTDVELSPPSPPEGAHIIGLAYDFGPVATFDPPITFEYTYEPAEIPEDVAEEDLVLAYYDEEAGKWVELPSTVDVVTHAITASVSHFTTFAIIGAVTPPPPPAPAAFSVASLSIQPIEVQPKEAVTIGVSVANTGGTEGSYSVVLTINGAKEAEESVTVAAGSSQSVTFSVTREEAGSYSVVVDGESGSFTVVAPAPEEIAPPEEEVAPPEEEVPEVPPAKPAINWPVVGGIIAAVAGLLIFFLVFRRRAA